MPGSKLSKSDLPYTLGVAFSSSVLCGSRLVGDLLSLAVASIFRISSIYSISVSTFYFPPRTMASGATGSTVTVVMGILVFVIS